MSAELNMSLSGKLPMVVSSATIHSAAMLGG